MWGLAVYSYVENTSMTTLFIIQWKEYTKTVNNYVLILSCNYYYVEISNGFKHYYTKQYKSFLSEDL
jgi:hypothetical protein